jgi:hypothetical protein
MATDSTLSTLRRAVDVWRAKYGLPGVTGRPTLEEVASAAGVSPGALDSGAKIATVRAVAVAFGRPAAELFGLLSELEEDQP